VRPENLRRDTGLGPPGIDECVRVALKWVNVWLSPKIVPAC